MCLADGTYSLEDLIRDWKVKERSSLQCNRMHVAAVRRQSHQMNHRGLEYVWYWTWDLVLNRILCCYKSLSLTHQFRITHSFEADDGEERLKWLIPDIGIIRQTVPITINGTEFYMPHSRLYAIGEIKPGPTDDTRDNVVDALNEALTPLDKQVRLFFKSNPNVPSVVGIFIAGPWWGFEVFTRDNLGPDPADDGTFVLPSENSEHTHESTSDTHKLSDEFGQEYDMETSETSTQTAEASTSESSSQSAEMMTSDSSNEAIDAGAALSSSDPIDLFSKRHQSADDSSDNSDDSDMQVDDEDNEMEPAAEEEEEEEDNAEWNEEETEKEDDDTEEDEEDEDDEDEGNVEAFYKLGTQKSEMGFKRLINELSRLEDRHFAMIPF